MELGLSFFDILIVVAVFGIVYSVYKKYVGK